jgi:hypothetical protein
MAKRTVDIVITLAVADQRGNHQCSLHRKGSGYSQSIFQPKRSGLSSQDDFLSWDDDPAYTTASVQNYYRRQRRQDGLPAFLFSKYCFGGLFIFQRVKSELADLSLSQGSLRMGLKKVVQTISKNESNADFQQ